MSAYADTGFLFSLYVNDGNTDRALKLLPAFRHGHILPLTPLHRLELRRALAQYVWRFNKGEKQMAMDSATASGVWTNIETDTHRVFSGGQQLDWGVVVLDAEQLTTRWTPQTGTRGLDTLHVAAARSLGARTFISFDNKQRELAKLVGLTVLD